MEYRRAKILGGTFFFTLVTHDRSEILCQPTNIAVLGRAFKKIKKKFPFSLDSIVVLPDHLHFILTLPEKDDDYPLRIRMIKGYFSRGCIQAEEGTTPSRMEKNEKAIWQRRYWEHAIKDDEDLIRHIDYIHINPVKHGLVHSPKDWRFSSFHRFVKNGMYDPDWGSEYEIEFQDEIGSE